MRDHRIAGERIDLAAAGDPEPQLFLHLERGRVVGEDARMQHRFRHTAEEALDRRMGRLARQPLAPVEPVQPVADMPLAVPELDADAADMNVVAGVVMASVQSDSTSAVWRLSQSSASWWW